MSRLASEATSELEKRTAAATAAALVESGMTLGLGTGSTGGDLLPILASRRLRLRCVATSVATERAARRAGLRVEPFDALHELDLAVDGADQVNRSGWLVKGGGGAHTREKIVAAAAQRFIVIASSDKLVDELWLPCHSAPGVRRSVDPANAGADTAQRARKPRWRPDRGLHRTDRRPSAAREPLRRHSGARRAWHVRTGARHRNLRRAWPEC